MKRWIVVISVVAGIVGALVALPVSQVAAQGNAAEWTCVQVGPGPAQNVRSGPGLAYAVLTTQQPGQRFVADLSRGVHADGYTWVPVRLKAGMPGWTVMFGLEPCPAAPPTAAAPTMAPQAAPDAPPGLDVIDQDGTLDRYEIAALARSVVLLGNVRGSRVAATGTGTIVTPDGLIITNAHVIEGARTVAVGLLDDLNDPPEYRYLGEIVQRDDRIDVAMIAIRTTIDGRPVDATALDLPYIPAVLDADDVFRGDPVYIFGYPGIGNDHLVVTTGSIVSVENGILAGQRLPVWYLTDAEIAPGNSGGLAVDGNGQFVGIPTFVEAETLTGGRLGGIRPAQVALMALDDGPTAQASPPDAAPDSAAAGVTRVDLKSVASQHGVVVDGNPGIAFRVSFVVSGWQGRAAHLVARVYRDDLASVPLRNPGAPTQYRDASGVLRVAEPITPCCPQTSYTGDAALDLFLPYAVFGLRDPGTHPLKVQIAVEADDGAWSHTLSWEFITVQVE